MEVLSLLRKIGIILPTLLTAVLPGLYKIYAENAGSCSKDDDLRENNLYYGVSANPLLGIFLYLSHMRSTSLTEPDNSEPYLYNAGVIPSIWSVMSPYEHEEMEWRETDAGPSPLTKAVCKDLGPFAFYFPVEQSWGCQLIKGAEEFTKEYFWELLLPFTSFITFICMYMLVKQEQFKVKWDSMLEYLWISLSFYPKYPQVQAPATLTNKIQELTVEDSEGEFGDGDQGTECQCEMCSVQLAAQILLKQRLEEIDGTFF